jgi:hypothetical protein
MMKKASLPEAYSAGVHTRVYALAVRVSFARYNSTRASSQRSSREDSIPIG